MTNLLTRLFKKSKINFNTCNEAQITAFIKNNEREDAQTKDYTNQMWGHTFEMGDLINNNKVFKIFKAHGFDGAGQIMFSKEQKLRVGDIVLLKLEGGKIGKYFILEIEFCDDPSDMFFATTIGIGYKD